MVDSQCGPRLLTTPCYDRFIIVGNRIHNMGVYCLLLRCAEATVLNTDHKWPHYTHKTTYGKLVKYTHL